MYVLLFPYSEYPYFNSKNAFLVDSSLWVEITCLGNWPGENYSCSKGVPFNHGTNLCVAAKLSPLPIALAHPAKQRTRESYHGRQPRRFRSCLSLSACSTRVEATPLFSMQLLLRWGEIDTNIGWERWNEDSSTILKPKHVFIKMLWEK